jgi:hypothetical protein
LLQGCAHFHRSGRPQEAAEDQPGQPVQRVAIDPNAAVSPALLLSRPDNRTYWGMTPPQTQCRAADKSGSADMMEKEYKSLDSQNCLKRNSKETAMKKVMLRYSAVEARNVAAGTALEVLYRLAELEGKADLVRSGQIIVGEALADLQKAKQQGLKDPPEFAKLQQQQLELAADLARLQLGIQQANGELGRLLNWHDLGLRGYFWPVDSFNMIEAAEDPEAAVALGMIYRPQLGMIRAVHEDIDAKNMQAMLILLRSYNGFLGMSRSESFVSFMGAGVSPGSRKETAERRRQMDDLLKEQEYIVAQEIRQAIHTIKAKSQLVALAKEKVTSGQEKLKDLQEKRQRGLASPLDVSAQRLTLAQAQGEFLQEVMAWHVGRAKLKQAQGLLALECGYTPEHPWGAVSPPCLQATPTQARAILLQPVPGND